LRHTIRRTRAAAALPSVIGGPEWAFTRAAGTVLRIGDIASRHIDRRDLAHPGR
jgi:hypothetical protein